VRFFAELRRRNVIRVGGVYALVAWLLVQVAVALEDSMGLPDWFDGVVVAALIIGFPIALIVAWAFELTPDGIKPSARTPETVPAQPVSAVDAAFIVALVAVLAVSVFQMTRPGPGSPAAGSGSNTSPTGSPRNS
jgi:hypothetical protein